MSFTERIYLSLVDAFCPSMGEQTIGDLEAKYFKMRSKPKQLEYLEMDFENAERVRFDRVFGVRVEGSSIVVLALPGFEPRTNGELATRINPSDFYVNVALHPASQIFSKRGERLYSASIAGTLEEIPGFQLAFDSPVEALNADMALKEAKVYFEKKPKNDLSECKRWVIEIGEIEPYPFLESTVLKLDWACKDAGHVFTQHLRPLAVLGSIGKSIEIPIVPTQVVPNICLIEGYLRTLDNI